MLHWLWFGLVQLLRLHWFRCFDCYGSVWFGMVLSGSVAPCYLVLLVYLLFRLWQGLIRLLRLLWFVCFVCSDSVKSGCFVCSGSVASFAMA